MTTTTKTEQQTLELFASLGVVLTQSHFLYASGRHGSAYVNKDALYPHTAAVQQCCAALAAAWCGQQIDVVAGPTIGGVILAQWTADALQHSEGREILACYAEERATPDGAKERYFGRGYDQLITGKRVLVVEDILTTGGSVRLVVDAVRRAGGTPVAVTALCNRGHVTPAEIGDVPLEALITLTLESWPAADCPLCQQQIPFDTRVGKAGKR